MNRPRSDDRSPQRRAMDEQIAALPPLSPPDLSDSAQPEPVESHLSRQASRPLAIPGIVENGLVRPLDTSIPLREHSRVIIVATNGP